MDIALFSPSSLFADAEEVSVDEEVTDVHQSFVERRHQFLGMELVIREFSFHQLNANLLWPGTFAFAEWLVQHHSWIEGRRCLELGSGTGALAIFLKKSFNLDITTSDYDDQEIEENIAHNCQANGITPVLPHVKHVKQYPNLIKSLSFLLKSYKSKDDKAIPSVGNDQSSGKRSIYICREKVDLVGLIESIIGHHLIIDVYFLLPGMCMGLAVPAFLMSWRRRIGKEDESLFFTGCENAGLEVKHIGSRVYCIKPRENMVSTTGSIDD
ncbi:hypothetical protein Goshw_012023 [Gossypium schwendimanii]|uniref:Methyltransferase small domain-containing protein n=1 Tax=Gossypium schwendimanii TaxID=34291 RepID=A0A7J9LGA0_GOSSC|nr:hypothetical protein [Gossypium schwendimanii]